MTTVSQKLSADTVAASVASILAESRLLTLATVSPAGFAHANIAFFAYESDFRIYILSPEETEHAANLAMNETAALTVYDSRQGREARRGVQLFGTMSMLTGASADRALACFGGRFEEVAEAQTHEEVLRKFHGRFFGFVPFRGKIFDEETLLKDQYVSIDFGASGVLDAHA